MYESFFGLRNAPFSIAPDPRRLYLSERHREALAHLLYGLDAGGGFVLLTGDVGAGKTTVCRCFLEKVPPHCRVAYVFNPRLTALELLETVCDEFGVPHPPSNPGAPTVKDCIDPLNAFLLRSHAEGRTTVLVIDEAQNLAPEVLEQLRLLTNLETAECKLLQIVLIGQPELRAMLDHPRLQQLSQRVIARYHLGALNPTETRTYIFHRLALAGWQGRSPFGHRALARIHALTGGIPRRINVLCDRALLGAYAAGRHEASEEMVGQAAREVFSQTASVPAHPAAWHAGWLVAAGALAGAALMAALLWGWGHWPVGKAAASGAVAAPWNGPWGYAGLAPAWLVGTHNTGQAGRALRDGAAPAAVG